MFLWSNTIQSISMKIGISILLFYFGYDYGMFSTLSRKVPSQSIPIARASYIPRTAIQQPTSWLSRIKTSLGTWNARRLYQSFAELFAIKTKEEHKRHLQELRKAGKPLSPTQAHITHVLPEGLFVFTEPGQVINISEKIKSFLPLHNLDIVQIDEIIKKEKEFFDAGYTILYHGTQPVYYGLHYIDTQGAILNKKLVENQVFFAKIPLLLRQKDVNTGQEERKVREHFIQQGTTNDLSDREFLLSCNPAITSNLGSPGSCTLDYWNNKRSTIGITPDKISDTLQEVIDKYDVLGFYINRYKKELLQYINNVNMHLKSGILLQIIFKDPELVEDCVYVSLLGGHKREVCLPSGQTSNVAKIMQAYSKSIPALPLADINKLQYRVILSADKLLDVFNKDIYENFEIHAYANPQSALERFHKEINDIMHKIEKDFNDKEVTMRIEQEWHEKFLEQEKELTSIEFQEQKQRFEKFKEFNRKRFGQTIEPVVPKPEEL